MPTRVGIPREISGISGDLRSPVYATALGLVQYGALHHYRPSLGPNEGTLIAKIQRFLHPPPVPCRERVNLENG